jgi:IS30 family transposase
MDSVKSIGIDVHKEAISIAVLNSSGKLVMECVIETKAITILDFLKGLRGSLHVTFEEGTWAAWLYDLIKPHVTELMVASKLILDWSPEQISGWLKIQYPEDESLRVSHETIYRSLFIQARGVLKKELMGPLRSKRRIRRSQHSGVSGQSRGQIVDAISIRERPAEIEDRAVPGHGEGDLISGSKNSHLVTLVERHSRFTTLIKVPSKDTAVVVAALSRQIRKLPATLRCSLTWDRGLEMAKHQTFTVATDVKVYFCDPQSPWQRGTNENTNGLLRQYFPKRTDLSGYTQAELGKVALRLNQRPRKTLGFQTPASRLQESVASTG